MPRTLRSTTNRRYTQEAQIYFDRLAKLGIGPTLTQRDAINTWIRAGLANGWWTRIYDFGLLCWNLSTANFLRGKIIGSVTLASGAATHTSNRMALSSNGSLDLGFTPVTAGMTTSGACLGYNLITPATNVDGVDMGCVDGSYVNTCEFFPNAFSSNALRMGNPGTAALYSATGAGTHNGLLIANRSAVTNIQFFKNNGSNSTIASTTGASGGSFPSARNLHLGCSNVNGVRNFFTNRTFSFWFAGSGLTPGTTLDNFATNTRTMLVQLGAV